MDASGVPAAAGEDLSAHPAVAAVMAARGRWTAVEHHRAVGSTNDVALARLRAGHAVGLVVVADAQHAGRGRAGRSWTDAVVGPDGPANLAVTATARAPREHAGLVPLAAGVAVADAYAAAGAAPVVKWPNDVLLGGAKAAGILVERHELAPGRAVVLIGCGLDLDWRGVERTGEARGWTSLAEAVGGPVERGRVLADLLTGLDDGLRGIEVAPAEVLDAYRHRCATLGSEVRVALPGQRILEGRAVAIDVDGALVVDDRGGVRHAVHAGDVVHLRPAP